MFILDKPYVSDFLLDSVVHERIPVLKTPFSESIGDGKEIPLVDEKEFASAFMNGEAPLLYTNSENAIGWISKHLGFTSLPRQIDQFKDKIKFRELLRPLDPSFFFTEVQYRELEKIDPTGFDYPFVIKPAVGFFSHGVHKVEKQQDWPSVLKKITHEVAAIARVYPSEVLDTTRFIIEEHINGREFAFDAWFNSKGEPVILSLLEHLFSSSSDVSDRIYISTAELFRTYLKPFTAYLEKIGALTGLKNFPLHMEVRVDGNGRLRPVEINPLRFGGWCTTADMTWFAWKFNPYLAIFNDQPPDWDQLVKGKEDKIYSNIVITNSTGYAVDEIKSFDYEGFKARFEHPLELRKADFKKFLIFGFLFAETSKDNFKEIDWILNAGLKEFISR